MHSLTTSSFYNLPRVTRPQASFNLTSTLTAFIWPLFHCSSPSYLFLPLSLKLWSLILIPCVYSLLPYFMLFLLYFTSLAKHKSCLIKLFSYIPGFHLCNIRLGKKHNYANLSHFKFMTLNHRWILHYAQQSYSVSLVISYFIFQMTIYFLSSSNSQHLFILTLLLHWENCSKYQWIFAESHYYI